MTKAGGRLVLVAVALLAASLPSWAQSQGGPAVAMDGAWHFTIAPYMWFSGISGDISVANLAEIPVEVRFSDMIEDVDVGLGWRHMDIDYDKGEGLDRQSIEIACDGPRLWLACVW